ncbi:MAG: glycosyltransferase family 2 protein [Acidobacteriota bacterium]
MISLPLILFWASAFLVVTTYLLYPAILRLLVGKQGRPAGATTGEREERPLLHVTLIVVAHNEEIVIGRRIRNLADLDYPMDHLQVLVLSDGSSDTTVAQAQAAAASNMQVMEFTQRLGKSRVLSASLDRVEGEIVVFTDANSLFEPGSLRALVDPFRDRTVGCVVGELVYCNTDQPRVARGEGLYWRYENAVKRWESLLGSTIVANGSIYAVRRDLIRPLVPHVDFDSLLPLQVIRSGCRVVFQPAARATEKAAETLAEEYRRKVRIINQQIWGLVSVRGLLTWRTRWVALGVFCHKVLRWSVPFLLGLNLLAALLLLPRHVPSLAVGAHLFLALAAVFGLILDRLRLPAGWLWIATYFWAVNLASLHAVLSCLAGRRILSWEKAASTR